MDLSSFQSQWLKHYYGPIAPTDEREQVYRRNYIYGALRLLETGFPLVQKVLGSKNFQFFAKKYALTLPESGEDLTRFGSRFSEFLLQRQELELREQIAEVAAMEWSWDWIKREN